MYSSIHCSTIYNSQDMEETCCPLTEEWIKKMCYKYTQPKVNEITPFTAIWTGQEIIILSEMSDTERQILYDIAYMQNFLKA